MLSTAYAEGRLSCKRRTTQADSYMQDEQRRIAEGKTAWGTYDTVDSYRETFEREYSHRGFSSLSELSQQRRERGQNVRVLDVMGPGKCREGQFDSIVSMTLLDHDINSTNGAPRKCLAGDIFAPFASKRSGWMDLSGHAPFDLILSRPEGGLKLSLYPLNRNDGIEIWKVELLQMYMRLRRLYESMSFEDSLGFFQMPLTMRTSIKTIMESLISPWIEFLRTEGIDVSYSTGKRDTFSLRKTRDSPLVLPKKCSL